MDEDQVMHLQEMYKEFGSLLNRYEGEMSEQDGILRHFYDVELGKNHKTRCRVESAKNVGIYLVIAVVAVIGAYMDIARQANFVCDTLELVLGGSRDLMEKLYEELGRRLGKQ